MWASCGINHEGVFVPGSTVVPANMAEAGCYSSVTHNTEQSRERTLHYKNQNTKQVNRMDRHKGIYISLIILYRDLARAKSEAFINKFII